MHIGVILNRDFKGIWIPAEIWLDENLTKMEMLFFSEIDSLDNSEGCFAGNEYFSYFFKLSKNRCSEIISSLKKKGKITIHYEYEGKEIKKRTIKCIKKFSLPVEKPNTPPSENRQPPSENTKDNNTYYNTKNFSDEKLSDFSKEIEILEFYNSQNDGQAEPAKKNKTTLRLIRATINQYSEEYLKKAITVMYLDPWSIENKHIRLNRLIKSDKRDSNLFRYAGPWTKKENTSWEKL